MVTRVNGAPAQGVWVERDVRFLQLTAVGSDFLDYATLPEGVNSSLEQVLEIIATRATLLGLTVVSDTVIQVMCGYANALDDAVVQQELEDAIIADVDSPDDITAAVIVVSSGFAQATPGTPD